MKKVFIAILTIALLLSACGNKKAVESLPTESASTEAVSDYWGTWNLDHLLVGNSEFTKSDLDAMGNEYANIQFILKEGGKVYMSAGSENGFGDWSETASGILLGDQELPFENGYLCMKISDDKTIFFKRVSSDQTTENITEPAGGAHESTISDEPVTEETVTTPSTDATTPESTEPLVDGMRPAFKEAMDAYESFYNEYCDFLSNYTKNPTDFSLLGQYAGMLSKAGEMDEAFKEWKEDDLNSAELQYYLEVNSRVLQKLAGVMNK